MSANTVILELTTDEAEALAPLYRDRLSKLIVEITNKQKEVKDLLAKVDSLNALIEQNRKQVDIYKQLLNKIGYDKHEEVKADAKITIKPFVISNDFDDISIYNSNLLISDKVRFVLAQAKKELSAEEIVDGILQVDKYYLKNRKLSKESFIERISNSVDKKASNATIFYKYNGKYGLLKWKK